MLLVDDREPEVVEAHPVLEQGVGPDQDARVAGEGVGQRRSTRPYSARAGQQRHPGRLVGPAELPGLGQRSEQRGDRPVVLLGEHLGRRQQRRLPARVHHLEHGPYRDDGLARADLALQQPVHRVGAGQVVGYLLADLALAFGERERQPLVERGHQAVGDRRPRHRRHRGGGQPPLRQRGLHGEGLVPLETFPRVGQLGPVLRTVDRPDRKLPGHRSYFSRTSAGIGSSPASSVSRTASTAREIRHELSLALAG